MADTEGVSLVVQPGDIADFYGEKGLADGRTDALCKEVLPEILLFVKPFAK